MHIKRTFSLLFALVFVLQSSAQEVKFNHVVVEAQSYSSGKHAPWADYKTRVIDLDCDIPEVKQTTYGSCAGRRYEATGFFRTEKIDGRWWFIDPNGYLHYQRGVTGVRPGNSEKSKEAFASQFRNDWGWIKATAKKFHEIGFYGSGSWSSDDVVDDYNSRAKEPLSNARIYNFMSSYGRKRGGTYQRAGNIGYPNQTIFVFDPEFETFCDQYARKMISKHKNDKSLLGYFSDNEMPLGKKNLEGYLTLKDPQDHGRKAAEAFLASKGVDASQITDELRNEFAGIVADRYYNIVSTAIRKYDPNHLYLGSRLHSSAKFVEEIIRAASKYCDVISMNFYGVWAPTDKHISRWEEWSDAPFMITEFYTKSMDSGLGNSTGAGFRVKTQTDRGQFYHNFCLRLLESKSFVGWQYFRYQDNDPSAKKYDPSNVDSNKGIVTNTYNYYEDFTKYITKLNKNVYYIIEQFDNQTK